MLLGPDEGQRHLATLCVADAAAQDASEQHALVIGLLAHLQQRLAWRQLAGAHGGQHGAKPASSSIGAMARSAPNMRLDQGGPCLLSDVMALLAGCGQHSHMNLLTSSPRTLRLAAAGRLLAVGLRPCRPCHHHRARPSLPSVTLRGYRFHAESFGGRASPCSSCCTAGPASTTATCWASKALADEYQVVFYDQRSSGLSPRVPSHEITLDSFIRDLDAFVDHYGQGRAVHLVGHSWGAMLASAYTGVHPGKVGKLVLAEPGFLDASTLDAIQGLFLARLARGLGLLCGLGRQWFISTGGDAYARDDAFLLKVLPLTQGAHDLCDGRLPRLQAWRAGYPRLQATLGRALDDPAWARTLDFRRRGRLCRPHALP